MTSYALELGETEIRRYQMMAEVAQSAEADLWRIAGIGDGARVADIGCGPGAISLLLAQETGPTGSVVAVDGDPAAVALARSAIEAAGHLHAQVHVGAADSTGLAARDFDVVMMRHVLAHNGGREQAIVNHLAALVRPGGTVYLVDVDLTMTKLFPSDPDLDDMIARYTLFHRRKGNDPEVGLKLRHLAQTAGLEVVEYRGRIDPIVAAPGMRPPPWAARHAMVASGVATTADLERWQNALTRLDLRESPPLIFPSVFVALAIRPV